MTATAVRSKLDTMSRKRNLIIMIALSTIFCIGLLILHNELLTEEKHSAMLINLGSTIYKWYNYTEDFYVINGPSSKMDDPELVSKLAKKYILPPVSRSVPYQLDDPTLEDTSMGQAEKIMSLFNYKTDGFFVECGALDGETRSNTLVFERKLGWTGLLIEADPLNFEKMLKKNRKAYLSPTCLSVKTYPMMVSFMQAENIGKISEFPAGHKAPGYVDVQCFPLYSYLLALNRTTVDYFSLDVEGNELDVLKTVPFDKVDIKTLSVEFFHVPQGKMELKEFMESKGYLITSIVTHSDNLANDFIFAKKAYFSIDQDLDLSLS